MEGNAELLALQRLDETCAQLQKSGNYLEGMMYVLFFCFVSVPIS